jgi:hypothetical protein
MRIPPGAVRCVLLALLSSSCTGDGPTDISPTDLPILMAAPSSGYDIDLVYLSAVSETHKAAFEKARARWEQVIVGDVPDVTASLSSCGDFHPATRGGVDDLVIYVRVDSIDGPFGTLGRAGPCYVRDNGMPITGAMTFDEADLDWLAENDLLVSTVLHEMGHVVGVGSTWTKLGLLSGTCEQDPVFTGTSARQAFDAVGGTAYAAGGKVPLENTGAAGDGRNCGHWRESVLGPELMTPILLAGSPNPLSIVTVQALADEGYVVNPAAADVYVLPAPAPAGAAAARDGLGLRLDDDILQTPRYRVDPDGRVERMRQE